MRLPRRRRRHPADASAQAVGAPLTFGELAVSVAEDLGVRASLDGTTGTLVVRDPVPARLGLVGLEQECARQPRETWPSLVAEHLERVLDALRRQPDHADWVSVRERVRSRVYRDDHLPPGSDGAVRPLAPGLVEALALDLPDSVSVVPRAALETWPLDLDAALAAGRAAVHADEPVTASALDLPVEVHALEGGMFTTSHVFCLEQHVALPPDGALVALPVRGVLLAAPLRPADSPEASALAAVTVLVPLAARLAETGPGTISDRLYWRRPDGSLLHLPTVPTPEGASLEPPPAFAEVLRRLLPPPAP